MQIFFFYSLIWICNKICKYSEFWTFNFLILLTYFHQVRECIESFFGINFSFFFFLFRRLHIIMIIIEGKFFLYISIVYWKHLPMRMWCFPFFFSFTLNLSWVYIWDNYPPSEIRLRHSSERARQPIDRELVRIRLINKSFYFLSVPNGAHEQL